MGNDNSSSRCNINERAEREIAEFKKYIDKGPDLKVNQSIVMFSSLTSTDSLKQHYEKRRMEAGDCAEDWIKNLAEKLAAFTSEPELAGLGALAVAVLIDIISFSPPEESIKEALRSVFAEEKASEVWDLIDECLKRYRMHINHKKELRSDIKRVEEQLSVALTKLKNSIVRDGHVTNQAMKIWVNGAAFHIQMLIHLERLGGTQNCDPIKNLITDYKEDLDAVFKKHEEMIKGKCRWDRYEESSGFSDAVIGYDFYLINEESVCYLIGEGGYDRYLEAYYDERYGKQKSEIKKHFSEVEQNLPELICQRGALDVRR
ncbi:uncharacterized protein LOC121503361 isoform X1 [Cheilinus undulatus]|uniref:uncharacterized protein LOC121503361 isoform X1 n=1 Tax=Cheilinus undulatus TaxID=241271 RepID=UPI001BD46572|nr:uncharacterized protein LOC121503361 isoform X1 [Cheilinus undulatus]XP_041633642.1 uncharacterized protein LOC121503361 isoform X1 [Cheilinus undulatus]XP_041633643.1 uncharacterized protein LOC121503361 isoform X1 [Cheilinus undulatus]XP_041633644.1 uncharacterized protein LOC121503361 isoform X1 [Cheilinus undulatus]XP_041633645.1 uncharacterized protein LOC121503361 isoform X1 [Cheilinus undulatus]XP_041633646.1 uncharacterized protein LOC121503361 isoform X1 [Cheilinus undulatus]XP_04